MLVNIKTKFKDIKHMVSITRIKSINIKKRDENNMENNYRKLLGFLCDRCDMFTFKLEKPHEIKVVENNSFMYPNRPLGIYRYPDEEEEFIEYKNTVEKTIINDVKSYIVEVYEDVEYCNSIGGSYEIYKVELNKTTAKTLEIPRSLYNWIPPLYPEDLCFYSRGECFLQSIAHENICRIFTDRDSDVYILKKLGFLLSEIPKKPKLSYILKY